MQSRQQIIGWTLVAIVACSQVAHVLSYPGLTPPQLEPEGRKFAEKPNALKKVAVDNNDLDDVSTNQLQSAGEGFSWSNVLGTIMQLIFNPHQSPSKSDSLDTDQGIPQSPWASLLSVGFKILSAFLGVGAGGGGDGIDKVDNGSPMQFISIVVNLLDALKTSFSHRSIAARSLGKKDSVSEAAVAGLSMLKGYVRSLKTDDDNCMQKYMCEANRECTADTQGAIFCQLGSYAASFVFERTSFTPFDTFYEAGRRGRSGEDCRQMYLACNEV